MSVEVFDQHDLVIIRLRPALQQGLSIRSQGKPNSRFVHDINENALAPGKVEKLDRCPLGIGLVDEVNPAGRKRPVKPRDRLIENALFFSSAQRHFPYSRPSLGVIKKAAIFGLSRIYTAA